MQAVLGAAIGLAAWMITSFVVIFTIPGPFAADVIGAMLLGALLGSVLTLAQEYWESRPSMPWSLIGGFAGAAAAGLAILLHSVVVDDKLRDTAPELNRLLEWTILGVFLGLALGLRWIQSRPIRFALCLLGGFTGGVLGGIMLGFLSGSPDVSAALAYALFGAAAGFAYGFKPVEAVAGMLRFVRSSDGKTHNKPKLKHPWNIDQTVSLVIGTDETAGQSPTECFIQVWDPAVAPRHARIFVRGGNFYLARHPDFEKQLARYTLRAGDVAVKRELVLHDGDEILMGTTVFRFTLIREEA